MTLKKSFPGLFRLARRGTCPRRASRAGGFTLIEVLVALAVLAIALAAVLRTMGQAIDISGELRDRTIAAWVANERAVRHEFTRDWPAIDTTEGTADMAGREWRWRERVSTTEVPEIRRVDIEILGPRKTDVLSRLAIFLQQPSGQPSSSPAGTAPPGGS